MNNNVASVLTDNERLDVMVKLLFVSAKFDMYSTTIPTGKDFR